MYVQLVFRLNYVTLLPIHNTNHYMKTHQALILEDSLNDQLAIEMVLETFESIKPTYVSTAKDFLYELGKGSYQLFIVDIMLQESLTGIDLIQAIRNENVWVIISSSLDCKDFYEAYRELKFKKFFIKKPVDEFVLRTTIESFLFSEKGQEEPEKEELPLGTTISLKQGNYLYKIEAKDIVLVETIDHATTIYTNESKYVNYTPLKTYEDLLKDCGFEKINRNAIVNMDWVKRINLKENYVEVNKHKITISRTNRPLLLQKYGEV